ncbi:MAG: GlxA family transcriptional regulator [Alphaproteobacteria bacterium]|jgi:transcriptional regulator GlxA family with amidase domain|nr:GlxA family transcriptional regulator [Alphaproteobacteria bacterium]MDP6874710.1 GlxA family transcriptional regulator [Alphaproteobacteria bacterium]
MEQETVGREPRRIGFFLLPGFTMIALTAAIEPLRLAQHVSGRRLYDCHLISADGGPVAASNGIELAADLALKDVTAHPMLFVCGGINSHNYDDRRVLGWLRRLDARGGNLGALCTGSAVLARAGLLDGYRCTVHWENLAGLIERYPDIEFTSELFEIDRDRLTCSGGTAALDMMLNIIALDYDDDLAARVAEQLLHERIRDRHDQQRMPLRIRLGGSHPKLRNAVAAMEQNLEEPLAYAELAAAVGLSTRHLERLFQRYFHMTPTRYYLELRLNRARQLLRQTDLSVTAAALACGFVSASHFSKSYRDLFGNTPRAERRQAAAIGPTASAGHKLESDTV